VVTGERGPEDISSRRVIIDAEDELFRYMPTANPFLTLTKLRKRRRATQYRFDWFEQDEFPRNLVLTAASIVGDTTLDVEVGTGARVAKDAVLLNTRTRERVQVSSVAADVLTVVRGIGTTQVDMAVGDTLVLCGYVAEDGSDKGALKTPIEANVYNFTETVRTIYGVTGRQQNTDAYGGRDLTTTRKTMAIEHAKTIEHELFFGRRHERDGTDHKYSYTGGLEHFITSNVWDVTGVTLSERAFVEMLEEGMRWGAGGAYGSKTKYLYASMRWLTEIEFWAKDKIQHRPEDKVAGLALKRYESTHGTVMLVNAPVLDYNHQDVAVLCDMNELRYVYHQGRDTKLLEGRQGNGIDGMEEEWLTDFGLECRLEASHVWFKGLS
jgi:hypothetical protein